MNKEEIMKDFVVKLKGKKKKKKPMRNITINIPENYDENILKLIDMKRTPNRSAFVRSALREFLHKEINELELLGYFKGNNDLKLKLEAECEIENCD